MSASFPTIVGIGNALVDLTFLVDSLEDLPIKLKADSACLVDTKEWMTLSQHLGEPSIISPGGSSGNTIAGFAALGGTAGFIGIIANDRNGKRLTENFQALSICSYLTELDNAQHSTGNCIVIITPDGTRTMAAFIGAAGELSKEHITEAPIANADILFLEGYLFDKKNAQEAFHKASKVARQHQTQIAFSLSDISCVEKHNKAIRDFLKAVDIIFANKQEIYALTGTDTLKNAHSTLLSWGVHFACITSGADGVYTFANQTVKHTPARAVTEVVDLNGAGDGFAAGFLFAYSLGTDFHQAAVLGNAFGAKIVETMGPRPHVQDIEGILKSYMP